MTENERGILIVDAIFYGFLGLVLLSFIHWQTKVDAMSAIELISYVNKGNFALKAGGLFCFMGCCVIFMLFCVIATFIIMGKRLVWLGLMLSVGLAIIGIAWMLFSFDKLDYCINVGSTERVATYIVPKSHVKQTTNEDDHPYQLAVPKNRFIEKTMVKSKQVNAKKLIAGNKKLEREIKSTYFDLMDVLLDSLNKVSDLNAKRVAINKNLEKLKERTESNNYVKQFEVVKELHKK